MNTEKTEKRGIASLYRLCPGTHITAFVSAGIILLHLLTRHNRTLMGWVSENIIHPIHRALSVLWSLVPFSGAELMIGLAVVMLLVYIISNIARLVRNDRKLRAIYRLMMSLVSVVLAVYAGFCLLWGTYYYGDDFMAKSGLRHDEISAQELETVTRYFAGLANEYSAQVERDENGFYTVDRREILAKSPEVFREAERLYPCLSGPDIAAKGVHLSRVMSYLDFTGFFFPFTAEANVNTDFPPAEFAATVAHELSHQRGVAKEQEANFTAVLACLTYGDTDYCYSAAMLAYTCLGNALHSVDYDAWKKIFLNLDEGVVNDIRLENAYWRQFETPVQQVSNTVYEGFLQSYDQSLGLKSYGACVDLLVNYYIDEAMAAPHNTAGASVG